MLPVCRVGIMVPDVYGLDFLPVDVPREVGRWYRVCGLALGLQNIPDSVFEVKADDRGIVPWRNNDLKCTRGA